MLSSFKKYISEKSLFSINDKLLLAISGGVDSVVLAYLLKEIKSNFALAHCNFQLRGKDSDEDEIFVKDLAQKLEIEVFIKRFDTKKIQEEGKASIQMIARDLRYEWFEDIRQNHQFDYILTAHQANDVVETILFNLTRGTGIAGLHGIQEKQGEILRPLLFATRQEIENYAQKNQISWREDLSNQDNKYRRNLIRNEIIPLFKKLNPNLENTLVESIEKFRSIENVFEEKLIEVKNDILKKNDNQIQIDIEKLDKLSEKKLLLFHILKPYKFTFAQSKQIIESLAKQSGKIFYSSDYQLVKDRKYLILTKKEEQKKEAFYIQESDIFCDFGQIKLKLDKREVTSGFEIPKSSQMACLDFEKLKFPLLLRHWREGDYFRPLGMKGKQKISDFLINQKVPLNLKSQVYVLCSGKDITWILDYRVDNRFKITENTKHILWIEKIA